MYSLDRIDEEDALYYADRTWGDAAVSEQIDRTLHVRDHLDEVPEGARILNLGAGPYFGIDVSIQLDRPDLQIIKIDPGYRFDSIYEALGYSLEDLISLQSNDLRTLGEDDRWMRNLVAGIGERLPLRSNSVQFVFSHAGIPENMQPEAGSYRAALTEVSRVLTPGGVALLGPMNRFKREFWEPVVLESVATGQFSAGSVEDIDVKIGDRVIPASTTTLRK